MEGNMCNQELIETLKTKDRHQEFVIKRQLCMFCMRKQGITLYKIGDTFNKNHATVVYAVSKIKTAIETKDKLIISVANEMQCEKLNVFLGV